VLGGERDKELGEGVRQQDPLGGGPVTQLTKLTIPCIFMIFFQCKKEVVDNFTTFHVWEDNMVFDDMMSWTDLEEIILSNSGRGGAK
jgi:hypothetical protein